MFSRIIFILFVFSSLVVGGAPQAPQTPATPTRAEILRGEYDRYRANNDLLYYHLDVRVDPDKKFISGKNTIRFRMLKDDTRIQLDLVQNLNVDKICDAGSCRKNGRVPDHSANHRMEVHADNTRAR